MHALGVRRSLRLGTVAALTAMGVCGITSPAAAESAAPPPAVFVDASAGAADYAVVVRAPYAGDFTLVVSASNIVAAGPVPEGCGPGSEVTEQVLALADGAAPADVPPLRRSVTVCELGWLDDGELRRIEFTDAAAGPRDGVLEAQLRGDDSEIETARWTHLAVAACAPPGRAPVWTQPNPAPGALDRAVALADTVGAARVPVENLPVADRRIDGVVEPGARIALTGIDVCDHRIDRTVVATTDGDYLFAGLMPGRYALLDEAGDVLERVDIT